MASVKLHSVWLNDGENPSDFIVLNLAGSLSRVSRRAGGIVRVAGGGARSVVQAGQLDEWALGSPYVSSVESEWIDAHVGRPVWVRDWLGSRVFGTYFETSMDVRVDGSGRVDVSLTISEITPEVVDA